jgi:NTP pyrophosphatase (non-canonical NTP hydrolase)
LRKKIMDRNDGNTTIKELKNNVREFIRERKWEKFHNPKDLAEAICIEAAELLEIFQWVSPEEALSWRNVLSKADRMKEEIADIFIYCLSMANVMGIDITEAVKDKIKQNEAKYPVKKYYGKAQL